MRLLGKVLIQYDWCPDKKRRVRHRHAQRKDQVKITGRRQPSASQGERPQKKPTLQTPNQA